MLSRPKNTPIFLPSHFCSMLPLACSCLLVYQNFGPNFLFCSSSRHSVLGVRGVFHLCTEKRKVPNVHQGSAFERGTHDIRAVSIDLEISCRQVIYFHLPPAWEVISLINLHRQVHSCLSKPNKTVSDSPNQYRRIPIYVSMLVTYTQKFSFSINPSFIYVARKARELLSGVLIKLNHLSAITELQCKTSKRLSAFCLLLHHWLASS